MNGRLTEARKLAHLRERRAVLAQAAMAAAQTAVAERQAAIARCEALITGHDMARAALDQWLTRQASGAAHRLGGVIAQREALATRKSHDQAMLMEEQAAQAAALRQLDEAVRALARACGKRDAAASLLKAEHQSYLRREERALENEWAELIAHGFGRL